MDPFATDTAAVMELSRHLRCVGLVGDSALERGGEIDLVGVSGTPGTSRDSRE